MTNDKPDPERLREGIEAAERGDVAGFALILGGFGARVDDDLHTFTDRHSRAKLAEAVQYTLAYLDGDLTRRGIGREMDISSVEAIAITKAIEPIIGAVQPDLPVHDRKIRQSPVTRRTGD